MTSSTEFSAGSALASKHVLRDAPGCFLGVDEAGYGPNLGPLLIAVTRWRTPCDALRCDFYKGLTKAVSATAASRSQQLHVADSKVVHSGKEAFRALETAALTLLRSCGHTARTFQDLWCSVTTSTCRAEHPLPEWYCEDVSLPVAADPQTIATHVKLLTTEMADSGMQLEAIAVELVIESRFNQLANAYDSKGLVLSRLSLALLRRLWTPGEGAPARIVGDKHGGRNRYDELLAEVLDGEMILRLEESRAVSRYRILQDEIRFQVRGEEHLPVAAASLVAKYLRELCMQQFNRYWQQHLPELKPTCGYPGDARRFYADIAAVRERLNVDEARLWRSR